MDAQRGLSIPPRQLGAPATVMVRPLLLKPQWMNGLSERLLVSHYENNYGGAVRRLNAIRARLVALDWERTPVFEINGLKREELIAAGSVILHEIYFHSLGGHGDDPPTGFAEPPDGLAHAFERDFGSVMAWRAEFTAMAKALAGGSGWAILAWSERFGRLVNQWAADHATRHAGCYSDTRARHVRAFLSSRFWREGSFVRRPGDGKPELGTDRRAASNGNRRRSGKRQAFRPLRRASARRGANFGRGAEDRSREWR
jgi:Fe-Mn family superoxide dismutase